MNKELVYKAARLHKGQKRIVKNILNNGTKYNLVNASRQSGKSFLLKQLLLYFGINDPGEKCVIISPFTSQNLKLFDEIFNSIIRSGVVKKHNRTEKWIELINGSRFVFKSAENPNSIRSGSYKYVFCDEFAFFKKDVWKLVINPTMAAKKGSKAFIFSTPRGKNEFWELCMLGQNNEESLYSYNFMSYEENPNMDLEFIEECRKRYPTAKFQQEFMGIFVDNASVFEYIDCATVDGYEKPIEKGKYFAGLDLANKNDKSVLTIMNEEGKVVMIYAVTGKKWSYIVERVLKYLKEYNNAHCLVEVNSIGDVVYELLEKEYNNLSPIYTSNTSKVEYIEDLIQAFNESAIEIPNRETCEELHSELDSFEMKYSSKTRKTQYSARDGFHDDYVISLALSNKSIKDNSTSGDYSIHIR